jgi:hypothetical protein
MIVTGASQGIGAGVFFVKPFTDYTSGDFELLCEANPAITRSLATEYAKEGIRFNAVTDGGSSCDRGGASRGRSHG